MLLYYIILLVVYCFVFDCNNNKKKHLGFYRLPKVIRNQGEQCQMLSEEGG